MNDKICKYYTNFLCDNKLNQLKFRWYVLLLLSMTVKIAEFGEK